MEDITTGAIDKDGNIKCRDLQESTILFVPYKSNETETSKQTSAAGYAQLNELKNGKKQKPLKPRSTAQYE